MARSGKFSTPNKIAIPSEGNLLQITRSNLGAKSLIFLLYTMAVGFFLQPNLSHATTCLIPPTRLLAICDNGLCEEGFAVGQRGAGNWCISPCTTRPIVVEDLDITKYFSDMLTKLSADESTGIFELTVSLSCFNNWSVSCGQDSTLTRLSENSFIEIFNNIKKEWKEKEQKKLSELGPYSLSPSYGVNLSKYRFDNIEFLPIVIFSIIWPWVLGRISDIFRNKISILLRIAILFQIPTSLVFLVKSNVLVFLFGVPTIWWVPECESLQWQDISQGIDLNFICSISLILTVLGEVIYLRFRKMRSKATSLLPSA